MKPVLENSLKVAGFLFFLLNFLIFGVVLILTVGSGKFSTEWIILLLPAVGMLAGMWIRHLRFGIWRSLVITLSLLISGAILFIVFFVSPALEKTAP